MRCIYKGHTHDVYDIAPNRLVLVKTDRISACGVQLPHKIENKGIILNKISNIWFNRTKDIIPNHIIETDTRFMPSFFHDDCYIDRSVMVQRLKIIPFEFIIRGYIYGKMWRAYTSNALFCGDKIEGEYKLAQKLEHPIFTPTTKTDTTGDSIVNISRVKCVIGVELTNVITKVCFQLYDRCSDYALSKGLIIADTKFEFGLNEYGELVLADEIFTPDSSRFWDISDYRPGSSPKSYDKQLIRDWLLRNKIDGKYPIDKIPESIIRETESKYEECLCKMLK